MIDTLVFDIGNVLVNWYPLEYVKTLVSDEEQAKKLTSIVFDGPEFKKGDHGEYTRNQTREALLERYPEYREMIGRILDGCDEILTASEENTILLRELKAAGFSLYYLSNTNPSAFEYMSKTHEFFRYLDGGIASFRVKLLKPDPEIFKLFTKTYHKEPGQCVFVDDTPVNTAAAASCGFGTVTLKTIPSLREELMKFSEIRTALSVSHA